MTTENSASAYIALSTSEDQWETARAQISEGHPRHAGSYVAAWATTTPDDDRFPEDAVARYVVVPWQHGNRLGVTAVSLSDQPHADDAAVTEWLY
jgi:hypothetical protein